MTMTSTITAIIAALGMAIPAVATAQPAPLSGMIIHDMYITLKNADEASISNQIELGKKYLTNHPGEVSFTVTLLAKGLTRHQQVSYLLNDTDFTVAFHLVFENAKAHDEYQNSDTHAKMFIPKSSPNWAKIRIFDSEVQ